MDGAHQGKSRQLGPDNVFPYEDECSNRCVLVFSLACEVHKLPFNGNNLPDFHLSFIA
jgi:hypothetical protein